MSEVLKRRTRCAVYTRKSTDEGLDQEYNSIDAQRDAGHAYIASQRSEGWIPVADDYDDPAFSGGQYGAPSPQADDGGHRGRHDRRGRYLQD